MSYIYDVELSCSNPEVVKACAVAFGKFCSAYGEDWKEGDTEFYTFMYDYVPREAVIEVSSCFPDDVITCRYSNGPHGYAHVHVVEYSNGEEKNVDIETDYHFPRFQWNNIDDQKGICDKATAFFRLIDTTEIDKEGNIVINWFNDVVCYTFEYDGEDDYKMKVEATKYRNQIRLKVYEGVAKYKWLDIGIVTPFKFNGDPILIEARDQ